MSEVQSYLTESFVKFLDIIGKDSPYDKDAALAMVFILMERKIFTKKERKALSLRLIEKCLNCKGMFKNIIDQPSEHTSDMYDYCYYPNTMTYLAKYGALNISTLQCVFEKLNEEISGARGSSSMSECVHNIQGKAASAGVIKDCISIIQR